VHTVQVTEARDYLGGRLQPQVQGRPIPESGPLLDLIIRLREEERRMNDRFEIYQDTRGEWRWRRVAANGRVVGASTESYRNRIDCVSNAKRNGYTGN
jgi:uncharacterized protein YegP (UPF0339 family)